MPKNDRKRYQGFSHILLEGEPLKEGERALALLASPALEAATRLLGVFEYKNDSRVREPQNMEAVEIYSDGSSDSRTGAGGWACILRQPNLGVEEEFSGSAIQTTNNRMELTAVIFGLKKLLEPCNVLVVSDSQYVINGIEKGWARKWRMNGWRADSYANYRLVKNPDLWSVFLELCELHDVAFQWVKGHNGHPENERCDKLAGLAMRSALIP